jgi:hypothetical protein
VLHTLVSTYGDTIYHLHCPQILSVLHLYLVPGSKYFIDFLMNALVFVYHFLMSHLIY